MHTREQALERLREIEAFVQTLSTEQVNLSDWVSESNVIGCGTVCCVVGWLAEERMFGMEPHWTVQSDGFGGTFIKSTPSITLKDGGLFAEMVRGFRAAEIVLFGDGAPWDAYTITTKLFTGAAQSFYDPASARLRDHRAVFLARIPKAIDAINQMYDRIEAGDLLGSAQHWAVTDTSSFQTRCCSDKDL